VAPENVVETLRLDAFGQAKGIDRESEQAGRGRSDFCPLTGPNASPQGSPASANVERSPTQQCRVEDENDRPGRHCAS
jgi:hypothetical protein